MSLRTLPILALVAITILGCSRQPASGVKAESLTFGDRQVQQMLQDRPEMKGVMTANDPLYLWLVAGFNGERLGQRVHWNANSPQSGRSAEHGIPYGAYPPYISISGGTETTPIDKWASVIFEMNNLDNYDKFDALRDDAVEGDLDADEYASACVKLEFDALERTRDLFAKHPLPGGDHRRNPWYQWVSSELGEFEDYEAAFDVPGTTVHTSNFAYFRDYYVSTIEPYAKAMKAAEE